MFTRLPRPQGGLSLIELIIFMIIVGVATVPVLRVLGVGDSNSADPVRRKQALLIAEGYMEEVQLARFTFCEPSDGNVLTAFGAIVDSSAYIGAGAANVTNPTQGCATTVEDVGHGAGESRPYDNINDYVTAYGQAQRSFAATIGGKLVDTDAAGSALATNLTGGNLGNNTLSNFTTTLMLSAMPAATDALGLSNAAGTTLKGAAITSTTAPATMNAVRITITTTYGTGANDFVQLDGYRTRYAPNSIP